MNSSWSLPNSTHNLFQSKTKLKSEIIHLKKEELKTYCKEECVVEFGIFPAGNETVEYDFVAYKDVMELKSMVPAYGYVQEHHFQYFIYREDCADCTLILSLSSLSSADPELYITKGGSRLPTREDYDIRRVTMHSEILELSLQMDELNKHTSMQDYYVIGVYADTNTTFQLSVAGGQHDKLVLVSDGMGLKHAQKQFEIRYFLYYHVANKDVKITASVMQGSVDLYVTTVRDGRRDNVVEKLPENKDKAEWVAEDINSISQVEGKDVLIL